MEQSAETLGTLRRQLLDETRRQGRILADMIATLDRIESKFDRLRHEFDRAGEKLASSRPSVDRAADSMVEVPVDWSSLRPLIRAAIIEAFREHDAQA